MLLVAADAARRRQLERMVQASADRLREEEAERRRLLVRLLSAQDEERRRIAADLHDDSLQVLTDLTLRLQFLRERLHSLVVEELERALEDAEESVRRSIQALRTLVFDLWPAALEREGLRSALRVLLDEVSLGQGVRVELHDSLDVEPSSETRAIVYRIAREALVNVARHAHARRLEVDLRPLEGGILARIRDDGRGFDSERAFRPGHLGLVCMRERAEAAGGWLRIDSQPGKGTQVEFFVPDEALEQPAA